MGPLRSFMCLFRPDMNPGGSVSPIWALSSLGQGRRDSCLTCDRTGTEYGPCKGLGPLAVMRALPVSSEGREIGSGVRVEISLNGQLSFVSRVMKDAVNFIAPPLPLMRAGWPLNSLAPNLFLEISTIFT